MTVALVIILVAMALMSGGQLSQLAEPVPETQEERDEEQGKSDGCIIAITVLAVIAFLLVAMGAAAGG
jgi:hypothetical protein